MNFRRLVVLLTLAVSNQVAQTFGDETPAITLQRPAPYEVIQRRGYDPREAHENHAGGPSLGFADVAIQGMLPAVEKGVVEARAVPLEGATGQGSDWKQVEAVGDAGRVEASVRVPAGGWYRLEVRCRVNEKTVAQGAVEPFGVGEVFIVAGQSYATNCNDERFKVADPHGRVAAYDSAKGTWGVAHDPQPAGDGSDGGSIWPVFGDTLLPIVHVPIGLANVAVGGTSSTQWLPEGKLHPRLVEAGKRLGRFRAILWQQGESDVIDGASTADYVKRVRQIREAAAKSWKFDPPWLLAKSTLHPTVYKYPEREEAIRRGIDELCRLPGFRPGPDTDTLGGENRGPVGTRRHFSGIGQRRAAMMWFAAVWQELNRPEASSSEEQPGLQHPAHFATDLRVETDYLLYLPKDYTRQEKWPLVLFLHGSGERGQDLELVKVHGPPKLAGAGKEFPFIAVSPQCAKESRWENHRLIALLDDLSRRYRVDEDRIYVTGLSMGGAGTWNLAAAIPDRLAAIAPICGGGDPGITKRIAALPTWIFQGAKDSEKSVEQAQAMFDALQKNGGSPKYTLYPEAGHDAWTETYNNPEFYTWLLSQKRLPKPPEESKAK
jgi:poly(3-hydroxybutyrate) depolymerase